MEIHIKIIGIIFILLALVHSIFPKYFNWKKELATLNLINKQMMQVHTFFIALVVLLMGLLCISSSHELVTTTLGKRICLGFGIFWGTRFIIQFFGYSSILWKGKKFETVIHILFSALWTYTTAVFLLVFLQ
jgi:hypothetical protein